MLTAMEERVITKALKELTQSELEVLLTALDTVHDQVYEFAATVYSRQHPIAARRYFGPITEEKR